MKMAIGGDVDALHDDELPASCLEQKASVNFMIFVGRKDTRLL